LKWLRALADEVRVFGETEINFRSALRWLHLKWGVKRLLCEGGGELNDALFRAGLVDEIHLTICPKIFGGCTAPTIADGFGFQRLTDASRFELTSIKREKAELFTVFSRRKIKGFA
jgi:riboflavin biosynthesis pyrimidine reductase